MRTPEILAPAGSEESLLAALRCGADAVYVGGKLFSARQNAANFDLPQLQHAVELCHLYGAKLYLTVNTLIFESEFPSLVQFLQAASKLVFYFRMFCFPPKPSGFSGLGTDGDNRMRVFLQHS